MTERDRIRELIKEYAETLAFSEKSRERETRYKDINALKTVRPPVLIFEIPWGEIRAEELNVPDGEYRGLEHNLDEVRITANKNAIPNDPQSPFITSGVRLGTPAVTSRGFVEEDMKIVAECIYETAAHFEKADEIRAKVAALCDKYPIYQNI